MKLLAVAVTLALLSAQLNAGAIVQKRLDEFVIYNLPVAFKSGNTTVLFPSAISGLYAKSVAVQEQANADFLISFTPGNFYFTVRALKPEAEDHLMEILVVIRGVRCAKSGRSYFKNRRADLFFSYW